MIIFQITLAILCFLWATYAVFARPKQIISMGFFLVFLGQFARLPIPISDNGILLTDLLLPWILVLWFGKKLLFQRSLPRTFFGTFILIFLGTALLSVLLNSIALPAKELFSSSFYLIRLIAYFLYFYLCVEIVQEEKDQKIIIKELIITSVGLALAGIFQYVFIPDFTFMAEEGWDPHIGRLLSTWYDPNYIAGFFAIVAGVVMSLWLYKEKKYNDLSSLGVTFILLLCIALTFSRSGLVALGIVILVIGISKARPLIIIGLIGLMLIIGFNERAQERALGLFNGALSLITGSLDYDLDATSKLRVESWKQSTELMDDSYLYGIGYNTIQYKKLTKGLIMDTKIHSGTGSDSSILNIFITMGVLGLSAYSLLLWNIFSVGIRILTSKKDTMRFGKGIALGNIATWSALILHSFFVNSLLLPFFILILIPLLAILDRQWHFLQTLRNNTYQGT